MPIIPPSKIPGWIKEKLAAAGSLDYARHYATLVKHPVLHRAGSDGITFNATKREVQVMLDELKHNQPDQFRHYKNEPYEIDGHGTGALWYDPGTDSRFILCKYSESRATRIEKCFCTTDADVRGYRLFALSGWTPRPFACFTDLNDVLWVQHLKSEESSPISPETLDEFKYTVSTLQRRWNRLRQD